MPTDLVLDLARWVRPTDRTDALVLDRCAGPTLDVGCGPGRMVLELLRRGVPALGIDVVSEAVLSVRAAGGTALTRSVFGRVPGEGRWPTVLLLDGCVGIGGSADRLLGRVGELLAPGGVVVAEHDTDPGRAERATARLRLAGGRHSAPFAWAVVGLRAVVRGATAAGLDIAESWTANGRAFTACRRTAL
ncbi:MAG: class I SAM-dependent methyltransferase [Streptosporangiales bacterium]